MVKNRATGLFNKFRRAGLLYEDVEAECWLVFMKCTRTWTPNKGQLSTYFYGAVRKEDARIIARAMGFGTHNQENFLRDLKADCSKDLAGVRARFWPRTQRTPQEELERRANIEEGRTLLSSADPLKQFLVAQWIREVNPRIIRRELGVGATTMYNRRRHILSEMDNAVNPHPDLADQPPIVPEPHPDVRP